MVYHFGPSRVTYNKGSGPPFGKPFISKVNGARKVKSDAQVAMNKNSDPVQKYFLKGGSGRRCPNINFSKLLELSETKPASKLTFGLQG